MTGDPRKMPIVLPGCVFNLGINQAKGELLMTSVSFLIFFQFFRDGNADMSYLIMCQRLCYLMENLWSTFLSGQKREWKTKKKQPKQNNKNRRSNSHRHALYKYAACCNSTWRQNWTRVKFEKLRTSPDMTEIHMNVLGDWLGAGLVLRLQSPRFACS